MPSERRLRQAPQDASRMTAETFILAETTDSRKRSSHRLKNARAKQPAELCIFARFLVR
jgi:hypothetical protein